MDDDVNLYEVIALQGEGQKLRDKTEKVMCFNDKEDYMSLQDSSQEGPTMYEEPQLCARNRYVAVHNDDLSMKGPSDCHVKRCLCVLSLFVVILFLMTVASLGLAVYAFYSIGTSTSSSQIQTLSAGVVKNTELVNHSFTLFKDQLTHEAIQIQENIYNISISLNDQLEIYLNVTKEEIHQLQSLITTLDTRINDTNVQVDILASLQNVVSMIESRINVTNRDIISLTAIVDEFESQLNTVNSEVVSQRTFLNNLESQFNTTNVEVVSQRTSINTLNSDISTMESTVTSLQSQLDAVNSSLQLVRSQPSK